MTVETLRETLLREISEKQKTVDNLGALESLAKEHGLMLVPKHGKDVVKTETAGKLTDRSYYFGDKDIGSFRLKPEYSKMTRIGAIRQVLRENGPSHARKIAEVIFDSKDKSEPTLRFLQYIVNISCSDALKTRKRRLRVYRIGAGVYAVKGGEVK